MYVFLRHISCSTPSLEFHFHTNDIRGKLGRRPLSLPVQADTFT